MTETDRRDLRPRPPRRARSGTRRWLPLLIGLGVLVAVVGLVVNLVSGALFFYNADEAVERRAELGNERFTLQGAPIGCSIVEGFRGDRPVVAFSVSFGGVAVDVVHDGDPAELFQPGVPVVLDGAWVHESQLVEGFTGIADDGWHYSSDRMRVKHDEDYRNDDDYDDRLSESDADAETVDEVCAA